MRAASYHPHKRIEWSRQQLRPSEAFESWKAYDPALPSDPSSSVAGDLYIISQCLSTPDNTVEEDQVHTPDPEHSFLSCTLMNGNATVKRCALCAASGACGEYGH